MGVGEEHHLGRRARGFDAGQHGLVIGHGVDDRRVAGRLVDEKEGVVRGSAERAELVDAQLFRLVVDVHRRLPWCGPLCGPRPPPFYDGAYTLRMTLPYAEILPLTAAADDAGRLSIGGCDLRELADRFGTPLYVYDEHSIREACRAYRGAFEAELPSVRVLYAAKAWLSPALTRIIVEEGLGMDVVSGGELHTALAGGMPAEQIGFHGNAKGVDELKQALDAGVGRIIVDNDDELDTLDRLTRERNAAQTIMLRITPGVNARTHVKTTTGLRDSKFGFPLPSGQAAAAVERALAAPGLDLSGFHIHLGSPIYDLQPYRDGIAVAAGFAAEMQQRHGYRWREFSPGGGFAIGYTDDRLPPDHAAYAEAVSGALRAACEDHGLPLPEVHIEPGRSVVGRAGLALYSVVSRKEIPGTRSYVAVDGGMADNVRPAMYDSQYRALAAERIRAPAERTVTIAGKFCESGDVLVRDAELPDLQPGELIAMPAAGAYQLAMESNYNLALRPAVVLVRDGEARLVRRRQTFEDLLALEMLDA